MHLDLNPGHQASGSYQNHTMNLLLYYLFLAGRSIYQTQSPQMNSSSFEKDFFLRSLAPTGSLESPKQIDNLSSHYDPCTPEESCHPSASNNFHTAHPGNRKL